MLNVEAALGATAIASPTALNFGSGGSSVALSQTIVLTNTATASETFSIAATNAAGGPMPYAPNTTVSLAPGASAEVAVRWEAASLPEGPQQGFVQVRGSSGGEIRVPWWYAVSGDRPAGITVLEAAASGRRNSTQRDAILFRVTDASGLPLASADVRVHAVSGDGSVVAVRSRDSDVPGLFSVQVRLGPAAGANVFRIEAGTVSTDVTITGN
jgi:minor extracellular serine protease Vpr